MTDTPTTCLCTHKIVCTCGYWAKEHEGRKPVPRSEGLIDLTVEGCICRGGMGAGHAPCPVHPRPALGSTATFPPLKRSEEGVTFGHGYLNRDGAELTFRSGPADPDKPGPDWADLPAADNCCCLTPTCTCGAHPNLPRPRNPYAKSVCYCIPAPESPCPGCPKWSGRVDGHPFTFLWAGSMVGRDFKPFYWFNTDLRPWHDIGPRQFTYQFAMQDSLPPLPGIPGRRERFRIGAGGQHSRWEYGTDGFGRYQPYPDGFYMTRDDGLGGDRPQRFEATPQAFRVYNTATEHSCYPPRKIVLSPDQADDIAAVARGAERAGRNGEWRVYREDGAVVFENLNPLKLETT